MDQRLKTGLVLAAGLGVGFAAGGYLGFRAGFSFILDNCVSGDTKEIRTIVAALKDIRTGASDQGLEKLEAHLDDQLVVLDPDKPYPLKPYTVASVEQAIKDAKSYRSAYPRTSKRDFVDKMVSSLFSRH